MGAGAGACALATLAQPANRITIPTAGENGCIEFLYEWLSRELLRHIAITTSSVNTPWRTAHADRRHRTENSRQV
jgi:hypothetical protein